MMVFEDVSPQCFSSDCKEPRPGWSSAQDHCAPYLISEHSVQGENCSQLLTATFQKLGLNVLLRCLFALLAPVPSSSARSVVKRTGCDPAGFGVALLWKGRGAAGLGSWRWAGAWRRQRPFLARTAASCGLSPLSRQKAWLRRALGWPVGCLGDCPSCLLCQGMACFPCSSLQKDLLPTLESIEYNSEPFMG